MNGGHSEGLPKHAVCQEKYARPAQPFPKRQAAHCQKGRPGVLIPRHKLLKLLNKKFSTRLRSAALRGPRILPEAEQPKD